MGDLKKSFLKRVGKILKHNYFIEAMCFSQFGNRPKYKFVTTQVMSINVNDNSHYPIKPW